MFSKAFSRFFDVVLSVANTVGRKELPSRSTISAPGCSIEGYRRLLTDTDLQLAAVWCRPVGHTGPSSKSKNDQQLGEQRAVYKANLRHRNIGVSAVTRCDVTASGFVVGFLTRGTLPLRTCLGRSTLIVASGANTAHGGSCNSILEARDPRGRTPASQAKCSISLEQGLQNTIIQEWTAPGEVIKLHDTMNSRLARQLMSPTSSRFDPSPT